MPINLNDRAVLRQLDPQGMLDLVERFPDQCREALRIAEATEGPALEGRPSVVVLAGMGGSAAGGDFVRALFEASGTAAFHVVRDYNLPHYVGVGDVVFCASYSGNTEETLSVYAQAKASGARIVAVTSGGKLRELAEADGYSVFVVPGGQPPRSALGYMVIPVLVACHRLRLLPELEFESAFARLEAMRTRLSPESADNAAMALARELHGVVPILYGLGTWQALIANRWRCQINENAKVLAFVNSYPELDHNEIMGWVEARQQNAKFRGVRLEDGTESPAMRRRAEVTEELIGAQCPFTSVRAEGESLLERLLTLTYFGDWVSMYLARLNEVDPTNIASIDRLKEELAKLA